MDYLTYISTKMVLNTALAKNHAKPTKSDTSHVEKLAFFIFYFSQLIMSKNKANDLITGERFCKRML